MIDHVAECRIDQSSQLVFATRCMGENEAAGGGEHLADLLDRVGPAAPPKARSHGLGSEEVLAGRDGRQVRQPAVDAAQLVTAVHEAPIGIHDLGPVAGIAKSRRGCREGRVRG